MSDFLLAIILFCVGSAAGFINVTAGGGSAITLPTLIFLGLDASVANGTNRIAILIQNISAIYSFKKEKYQQFNLSLKLSALTLPGAIAGAILAVNIEDDLFEMILGIIMILVIISMIIPKSDLNYINDDNKKLSWSVVASMFGIGFYGGFLQVGVGFLLMASLHFLLKYSLVYVNMHKVFIVFIYTIPAIIIFFVTDNINWFFGLTLAAGNALGGWWAAKASVKIGEKFIRVVLIIIVLIMSLKLLKVI